MPGSMAKSVPFNTSTSFLLGYVKRTFSNRIGPFRLAEMVLPTPRGMADWRSSSQKTRPPAPTPVQVSYPVRDGVDPRLAGQTFHQASKEPCEARDGPADISGRSAMFVWRRAVDFAHSSRGAIGSPGDIRLHLTQHWQ